MFYEFMYYNRLVHYYIIFVWFEASIRRLKLLKLLPSYIRHVSYVILFYNIYIDIYHLSSIYSSKFKLLYFRIYLIYSVVG